MDRNIPYHEVHQSKQRPLRFKHNQVISSIMNSWPTQIHHLKLNILLANNHQIPKRTPGLLLIHATTQYKGFIGNRSRDSDQDRNQIAGKHWATEYILTMILLFFLSFIYIYLTRIYKPINVLKRNNQMMKKLLMIIGINLSSVFMFNSQGHKVIA